MIIRKSSKELEIMREANRIVGRVLDRMGEIIEPGLSTASLDKEAEDLIRNSGATPVFKGYNGFPAAICASLNNEVVHGIPSERIIKDGDVLSVDVGTRYRGFCGDSARTYPVGNIDDRLSQLLKVTRESLYLGIEQAVPGNRLSDISAAVQGCVEKNGFFVVRDFVGHGIGRSLHEDPQIPNFGKPGRGPLLKEGMVLAIEPMVNTNGVGVKVLDDEWTVVTENGGHSAHFEHTIAITSQGPWILSDSNEG
jgi:methionyl aminopeptidase